MGSMLCPRCYVTYHLESGWPDSRSRSDSPTSSTSVLDVVTISSGASWTDDDPYSTTVRYPMRILYLEYCTKQLPRERGADRGRKQVGGKPDREYSSKGEECPKSRRTYLSHVPCCDQFYKINKHRDEIKMRCATAVKYNCISTGSQTYHGPSIRSVDSASAPCVIHGVVSPLIGNQPDHDH